jgi:hypothetical protein
MEAMAPNFGVCVQIEKGSGINMTLVLAAIRDEEIHLVADTLISFDARLGRQHYHALKILSLSPTTVLAFSGGHERALQIFFDLCTMRAYEFGILELANLIAHLRAQTPFPSLLSGDAPDFLIARTMPEVCVYRINDHGISKCSPHGWIGNPQAAAHVAKNITSDDRFDITAAFQQVVHHGVFSDVGGHIVHVRGDRAGFKFLPHMRLVSPRYIPVEGWNIVDFGNAQTGGYGFTTITPCDSGHNGYGVFFFQGGFGLFFYIDPAKKICETLKAYATTPKEFIEILEGEVGFPLDHCGALG